jgi:hypothetical protein
MGQRKKNAARGPFLLPARGKRQQDFSPFEYSGHGCSESAQADFAATGPQARLQPPATTPDVRAQRI